MNKKKLRKLISAPDRFFLDSRFFYFRRIGQLLVNAKIGESGKLASKVVAESQGEKEKNNEIAVFYISERVDGRIVAHLRKICAMAEVKVDVADYDLEDEFAIQGVLTLGDDIAKITFSRDAFFEVSGNVFLRKGVKELYQFDFECVSDVIASKAEYLAIAFWKLADDNKSLFQYYKDKENANRVAVVNYGLKGGVYSQELTSLTSKVISENKSLTDSQINFMFSKLYRIRGPHPDTEAAINAVLKERKRLNSNTLMKLASFLCEAGDYSRCVDVAKLARSSNKSAWESDRYIGLSNFLYKEKIVDEPWAEQDAFYFDVLRKNQNNFIKIIESNDFNFSVVGNSPCELGLAKGSEIDLADVVIRFNSANTDFPYSEDYGKKSDVLVVNPRYYETKRNVKDGLSLIVISDGSLYSTRNLAYRLHDLQEEAPICLIPDRVDRELVSILGSSPSSGMKILYWLYLSLGLIDKSKVFGFSMTDQEDGVSTNYQVNEKRILPIIHDWKAEKALLEKITGKNNDIYHIANA